MNDPFDLQRFVIAQNEVYPRVVKELTRGQKTSHWIWFIFPQRAGLGHSWMAKKFEIGSRAEASAYLGHPTLGPRLAECTALVTAVEGRDIEQILGGIDALKFRSSMTLFEAVAHDPAPFARAIEQYFAGGRDSLTLDWLKNH